MKTANKKLVAFLALALFVLPTMASALVTKGDIERLSGLALRAATAVVTTLTATTGAITTLTGTTSTFTTAVGTTVNAGASGTAGSFNVFPTTAAKGKLVISAIDNAGAFNSTIRNSDIGQATVYSLPDAGAATANILTDAGAQTVTGAKTFGAAGAVGKLKIAGTTSGSTILDATATAGSGTVTLPTTGTLATQAGAETLTNKTITDAIDTGTVVSSAISATSGGTGTTLTNITGLSVAVTAAKTYAFRAYVTGTSTTNSGVKFAFANSGSTTSASYTCIQNNGTTQNAHTTTTTMGNAVGAATTVFTDAECWGTIVVNAAGNLTMQFAQNASHSDTTTVNANGWMAVTRLN